MKVFPFQELMSCNGHETGFFLWLNGWLNHIWCAILLNDIMDLHMSSLGTLDLGVCFKQQDVKFTEVWNMWFFAGTLTLYHTHKPTQHTHGPVDLHTHINIYLHHLLCAHNSYLYYIEWIIHLYHKITFHNVFSFQELFTCKGHISVDSML